MVSRLIGFRSPSGALRRAIELSEQGKALEAFPLFARAAKAGLPEAEYRVARCYLEGVGVPPSRAEGSVRTISPDSFTPQEEARTPTGALPIPGSADPYYRVRITIDRVGLHDVPTGFRVTPGMPVTADIKVGKRTVLGYLLGKVMPLAQEGMREP